MKNFLIIADSCCDLKTADFISDDIGFTTVPIFLTSEDKNIADDEDLCLKSVEEMSKKSKNGLKSACPSPETFAESMRTGDNIICITISSKLSGSFNSARLGAEAVRKESPEKNIFVLDSLSATAGMALIIFKLKELAESGEFEDFDDLCQKIAEFRDKVSIRFVLQDLSNLIKTGRMSIIAGLIASVFIIKPVCGDNGNGEIKMHHKVVGAKRALTVMGDSLAEKAKKEGANLPVIITHSNNSADAQFLQDMLTTKYNLTNIKILPMRGTARLYAGDKGIAMAY